MSMNALLIINVPFLSIMFYRIVQNIVYIKISVKSYRVEWEINF